MSAVMLNVFLAHYNADITLILPDTVTPTELSLLRMLIQGMSVSEIARKRCRSVKTISCQKAHLYRKLRIHNDLTLWPDLLLRYRMVLRKAGKSLISKAG
ncbi:helix-turn-helix domain-containing protein [Salmonella enterica]|uniref:Helix-turn-helix domain-containing protein n=2 Tax=Salmonella enterica TaxID=28901 RepID=A0A763UKJ3_SALER|nr:helix-turn-helix domain-containing protein [Salmonella enterica subsp. enterica serovar Chester]EEM9672219.1 helix-turn-helix transcriptional regulator [Salmonella enterica subsp. enterica serovar Poona]MCU7068771.1 helix-turn-helix domain-containing protein [Salmonella enterica]EHJ6422946.1 helix-turn-helix domain-containing protein [Salmonella enterica subsp. enterica serovar Chester]MCU7080802.1 helix-turn-helix domain-containing protein [Salmonella enterica]